MGWGDPSFFFLSLPGDHAALSQGVESVYFNKFPLPLGHNYIEQFSFLYVDIGLDSIIWLCQIMDRLSHSVETSVF